MSAFSTWFGIPKYTVLSYCLNHLIWQDFHYKTNSNRYNQRRDPIYYHHWLPAQDVDMSQGKTYSHYQPFHTLIHSTSLETARTIIKEGLKPQLVKGSSVVNPKMQLLDTQLEPISLPNHPLSNKPVLWYGPCTKTELELGSPVARYGNVTFTMNTLNGYEGIRRRADEFKYYFIEQIDYEKQSASRILITRTCYPELQEYDPQVKGGPWYTINGHDSYLTTVINSSGTVVQNSLEFMREQRDDHNELQWWLKNHVILYTKCVDPRHGVSINDDNNTNEVRTNTLKLMLGIITTHMYDGTPRIFGLHANFGCANYDVLKMVHDEAKGSHSKTQLQDEMSKQFRFHSKERLQEKLLLCTGIQQFIKNIEDMSVATKYILSCFESDLFETDSNRQAYSLLNIYRNMLGFVEYGKEDEFYDELCRLIYDESRRTNLKIYD